MQEMCPCCTGKTYDNCCKPLHDGGSATNALLLMRSRYSAYAMERADYIIRTTHPKNPHFRLDIAGWTKDILKFCRDTHFQKLEILEFIDGDDVAYVTFVAHLKQNHRDVSFCEKSRFEKLDGSWLYHSGTLS